MKTVLLVLLAIAVVIAALARYFLNPFGKKNNSPPPKGIALVVYTGDVTLPSGTWRALVEDNWHSDDGCYVRSLFLYKENEIDFPSISVFDDDGDGKWDRVKQSGSITNRPTVAYADLDRVVYEIARVDNIATKITTDRGRRSPKLFSFVRRE